jgi:DNA-binding XRE family transcriptional regulator
VNFQVISEQGQKFVKVPLSIFEKLEEDAEMLHDIAVFDAAKAEWLADETRTIPHSIVKRVVQGESTVLVWRDHRGMTQQQLADACSISRPLLSQIESGKKTGSVATLKKIAEALGCLVDDLI